MSEPSFSAIRDMSIVFVDWSAPQVKYRGAEIVDPSQSVPGSYVAMARLWENGKRPDLSIAASAIPASVITSAIGLINAERRGNETVYTVERHGKQVDVQFLARILMGRTVDVTGPARISVYYVANRDGNLGPALYAKPDGRSLMVTTEGGKLADAKIVD